MFSSVSMIKESTAGSQEGPVSTVIGYRLDNQGNGSIRGAGREFSMYRPALGPAQSPVH
jgi:hypothetical protein